jgi:hypothetical protein
MKPFKEKERATKLGKEGKREIEKERKREREK